MRTGHPLAGKRIAPGGGPLTTAPIRCLARISLMLTGLCSGRSGDHGSEGDEVVAVVTRAPIELAAARDEPQPWLKGGRVHSGRGEGILRVPFHALYGEADRGSVGPGDDHFITGLQLVQAEEDVGTLFIV